MTSDDLQSRFVGGSALLRWRFPALLLLLAAAVYPFDAAVVGGLNPDEACVLDGVARWLDAWSTRLLVGVALLVTVTAFLFRRLEHWREPLSPWLLGWVMTDGVVRVAKTLSGRPRPCHPDGMGDSIRALFERPDTMSFPSGHTATAVAFAIWGWLQLPGQWMRWSLSICAVAIALGRTYIGAHYLSDVLVGAAVGWACMAMAHHLMPILYPFIVRLDAGVRHRFATVMSGVLMMTWILKDSARLVNPVTGHDIELFRLETAPFAKWAEPVAGPGLRLSAQPDLLAFCQDSAMWAVLLACAVAITLRRRAVVALGIALLWCGAVGWVAFGGGNPDARLVARSGSWVFADLQNHSGDPTDGHISLKDGLSRADRAGLNLVQPTYHNKWSPAVSLNGAESKMFGMEWSAGDHRRSPLHLLVYNDRPEPSDLADERDPRRLIERVHEAGGLVIASHFWRGDVRELPTADELVQMGIDGFEVCGRSQEYRAEQIDRQRALRSLTESKSLLALASSDYHGRRCHIYQWMAVQQNDGESPADAMWSAMKARDREIRIVTRETQAPSSATPRIFIPWHVAIRYLRELTPRGRIVWMAWLWAGALALRFRSTRSLKRSR